MVVVAFTASGDMRILLEELALRPGPTRQWIGSESWVSDPELLRFGFCTGTIGFSIPRSVIPGFRDYLLDLSLKTVSGSRLFTEFWEGAFNCQLGKGEINSHLCSCQSPLLGIMRMLYTICCVYTTMYCHIPASASACRTRAGAEGV